MKILFPIRAFYPHHGGGPSLSVYWMAKALVRKGHDVTVVTTTHGLENKYPADTWNDIDGIMVQYCSSSWRLLRLTLRQIKNNDILHLTSLCYWPSVVIAAYSKIFTRKKIVWSPRGELADSAINGSCSKQILFKLYGNLFRRRVYFHGTSDKELEEITQILGSCKIIKLPNYLELSPKYDRPQGRYLLYLGRISPIKSLDKLFEALNISKSFLESDYKLLLAGKSVIAEEVACENQLRSQVLSLGLQDKIQFLGEVGGVAKDELLSGAYFSFLVSESENFGNVVVEAMAQGTPVVTSLGTPWGMLKEKSVGYHVSNEPSVLAKTIDEILNLTNEEYQELRHKVFAFCVHEFSINDNIQKWIDVYDKLLKHSKTVQ